MHEGALKIGLIAITLLAIAGLFGCTDGRAMAVNYTVGTGGVADRGKNVILDKNCGSCHTIPGISGARGVVGPPLMFFSRRTYIAGELPNQPENLIRWIRSPRSVEPNTAMPTLGLTEQEARDVAAYLYQLR